MGGVVFGFWLFWPNKCNRFVRRDRRTGPGTVKHNRDSTRFRTCELLPTDTCVRFHRKHTHKQIQHCPVPHFAETIVASVFCARPKSKIHRAPSRTMEEAMNSYLLIDVDDVAAADEAALML